MTYFATCVHHEDLNSRLDANYYSIDALEDEKKIKTSDYDYLENSLIRLASGGTPSGANYLDQGVLFIRTQNVQSNMIDTTDKIYISPDENRKLKRSQLRNNDVLLTITGVDLGRSAVVQEELLPANINQHSVKLEIKNLDPYFLTVFFNSRYGQSQIWRRVYGATRPALNYEEIKELIIPTPKPEIQRYIGNQVRKAKELREEAKETREVLLCGLGRIFELKTPINKEKWNYVQAKDIIQDKIGATIYKPIYVLNKNRLKINTKTKKIKEIAVKIYDGNHGNDHPKFVTTKGDVPFIRGQDCFNGILSVEKYISLEEYNILRYKGIEKGDIVYSIKGTVGYGGIYTFENTHATVNPACVVIRPSKQVNSGYLLAILESDYFKTELNRIALADSTRPQISRTEFSELEVPLVDRPLQDELGNLVFKYVELMRQSRGLINQAKQDLEDLIEGKFDKSKISEGV